LTLFSRSLDDGVKSKRLHGGCPGLVGAAHERADLTSGEPLHGSDELWPHRPLQRVSLVSHELGFPSRDQGLLGACRRILEHANDQVLIHDGTRPRGTSPREVGDQLAEWSRMHGLLHWNDDRDQYAATLQQKGYRAWTIESAVGFEGFVIAKSVGRA